MSVTLNFKRFFSLIISIIFFTNCTSTKYLVSDVTKYHDMSRVIEDKTFTVKSKNLESGETLAFENYSGIIVDYLENIGWKKSSEPGGNEDYIVVLNWFVDGPISDVSSRSSNFNYSFRYGNPYGFGYGVGYPYDSRTKTRQLYSRNVEIIIYNAESYKSDNPGRLFESSASSLGSNAQINAVMPFIIESIFQDFPGVSGQTKTVRVDIPAGSQAVQTGGYSYNRAK